MPGGRARHFTAMPGTHEKKKNKFVNKLHDAFNMFNPSQNAIIGLQML
jgi:hypothetical protein